MRKFFKVIIFLLFIYSCGNEQILKPDCSECIICHDGKSLFLQYGTQVKKYVEYKGELIDPISHKIFLTKLRCFCYKDTCSTAWGEEMYVYIHQVEDNQKNKKASSKKCFVREEFVKDAFSADGRWPLREIYFDEDYNIIKINIYSNVSFK